jgi:hypothetical protein
MENTISSESTAALELYEDIYSREKVSSYYVRWKEKGEIKGHYRSMKQKEEESGNVGNCQGTPRINDLV